MMFERSGSSENAPDLYAPLTVFLSPRVERGIAELALGLVKTDNAIWRARISDRVVSQYRGTVRTDRGCRLWQHRRHSNGYGVFDVGKRTVHAHRAAWISVHGPIGGGRCVLHVCDVRHCVNPEHMFLGSRLDNVKDMTAKGRVRRVHGAMRADLLRRIKESNNDVEIAEAFDVPLLTVKNLRTTGLCHPNPW